MVPTDPLLLVQPSVCWKHTGKLGKLDSHNQGDTFSLYQYNLLAISTVYRLLGFLKGFST